jgi:hypothetical protein
LLYKSLDRQIKKKLKTQITGMGKREHHQDLTNTRKNNKEILYINNSVHKLYNLKDMNKLPNITQEATTQIALYLIRKLKLYNM